MARPGTWTTWSEVVRRLGRQKNTKARKAIQGHVTRLDLNVSHLPPFEPVAPIYPDKKVPVEGLADAVKQSSTWAEVMRRLGMRESAHNYGRLQRKASELGLDASHFRGQAWASHDLVVESDQGFMEVQVKSTTSRDNGRWCVRIHRRTYLAGAEAADRRIKRIYCANEVDFFFVAVQSSDKYVIPLSATRGMTKLTLDGKYAAYRVD
jgi:hypothetical protein